MLSTSCIDHFVTNPDVLADISIAQPIHLGDNLSNHEPIFMTVKIDAIPVTVDRDNLASNAEIKKPPMWRKASTDDVSKYRSELRASLHSFRLTEGVLCSNPNCTESSHLKDIDSFCNFITDSIESSVNNNFPCSSDSAISGWSDYVEPYRKDAKFWHAIWVSLGRPLNCEVHNAHQEVRYTHL